MFSRTFIQSFKFAFNGLIYAIKTQRNMRIHLYLGLSVILFSFALGLSGIEIAILSCVISFVLIAELTNTALEVKLDYLNNREYSPTIKIIKDMVAGVVLIASINAAVVGGVIFTPYLSYFLEYKSSVSANYQKYKNIWNMKMKDICLREASYGFKDKN